jgi:hypothetical protein
MNSAWKWSANSCIPTARPPAEPSCNRGFDGLDRDVGVFVERIDRA